MDGRHKHQLPDHCGREGTFLMGCQGGDLSCDADESPAHEVSLGWVSARPHRGDPSRLVRLRERGRVPDAA